MTTRKVRHREGRGCPCPKCEKKREDARQRYAEKYKGVPRNRATGHTKHDQEGTGHETRLQEHEQGGGMTTFHWLPNANRTGTYSWKCPNCDQWFHWSVDEQKWDAA